jgi:phosphoserine phosphatase RsbU/P
MPSAETRLIAAAVVFSAEQVRANLRHDAPSVALGVLFVAIGLAGLGVFRLRSRARDAAALWFGVFALLFGVRLLALAGTVRFAIGGPDRLWFGIASAITYAIPLPALLFLQVIFPTWRRVTGWLLRGLAAFAAVGVAADLALGRPDTLRIVNNLIILAAFTTLIVALFRQDETNASIRGLRIGALVFSATVVLRNLASLGLLPLRFDLEPFGFAVFLASLGRVLFVRTVEHEEQLVALSKELEVARRIQESILPQQLPRLQSGAVAARYRPMTAVAGDFYDFLRIDDRHLGILVADVSGHGVPAALIASMVKVAVSAQLQNAADPARVLSGINQTLAGQLNGQFVTAAYLFVDLEGRRMRYAAAGHPPLLWWRNGERTVEPVVENGLVLGLMPHAPYTFVERPIDAGDRFFLYTDGLVEATDRSDQPFGEQRLRDFLSASAQLSADQVASAALDQLGAWVGYADGRAQEDDLTVLVVAL